MGKFYHPISRCVFPSQDVTFDESVPFYRLFPYRSAPPPPPPLFLAPGPPPVDPLPPQGPAPSSVSQVDPLPGTAPVEVAIGLGAARGAASGGAASGGAELGCAESNGARSGGAEPGVEEPGGAETEGVEPGGAESEGAESGGAEPWGAALFGGPASAARRLSPRSETLFPQQLRVWLHRHARLRSGATRAGGIGDTGAGGAGLTGGAGGTGGTATVDPGGACTRGAGTARTSGVGGAGTGDPTERGGTGAGGAAAGGAGGGGARAGGTSAGGAGAGGVGAVDPGGTVQPRLDFVPLLQQVPDPESDRAHAASPTVFRLLATVVTDPSFESAAASALVAELVDFVAACRLDYATALVAESESASPPSVGGEYALEDKQEDLECLAAAVSCFASMLLAPEGDPDAPDIPTPCSYGEAIMGPYSSQWQAAMDNEMASWKSTGTYVDDDPLSHANLVDVMWIFRVKGPPGYPPAFKARYAARGFSQHQGVDYFQTFSPTSKMTTLWVLLHVAAQCDYELHSLDFVGATLRLAFGLLSVCVHACVHGMGSLHEEIWLRRPRGFTGSFPAGTQWSLRRPVYGLCQAPCKLHDTLRSTLAALGFAPCTDEPSMFLRTDTLLPPFYVLVYVEDLIFANADTESLTLVKSELQKRHNCTDLGELRSYLGLQITRDRARRTVTLTQSHMVHQVLQRFGFQFSLPEPTPLSTGHSLSAPPSDESVEPSGPYLELVGCLMYLMTCTRPDLAYPLSLLARYMAPGRHRKVHWDAAKRVLRYLCSRSGMGLVLGGWGPVVLTGHADASWVDDSATQQSSSCEAEMYAGVMAAQELRWLTYLLTDLGEQPRSPPVLYVDNKAMIALFQEQTGAHIKAHRFAILPCS
ncbi:unnamed protein product [Closterium sp. NIES-53]